MLVLVSKFSVVVTALRLHHTRTPGWFSPGVSLAFRFLASIIISVVATAPSLHYIHTPAGISPGYYRQLNRSISRRSPLIDLSNSCCITCRAPPPPQGCTTSYSRESSPAINLSSSQEAKVCGLLYYVYI